MDSDEGSVGCCLHKGVGNKEVFMSGNVLMPGLEQEQGTMRRSPLAHNWTVGLKDWAGGSGAKQGEGQLLPRLRRSNALGQPTRPATAVSSTTATMTAAFQECLCVVRSNDRLAFLVMVNSAGAAARRSEPLRPVLSTAYLRTQAPQPAKR